MISFVLIGLWVIVGTIVVARDRSRAGRLDGAGGLTTSSRLAGAGHPFEKKIPGRSAARATAEGEEGVLGPTEDR